MRIPQVDLHAQYLGIKDEIDRAIAEVISESSFVKGRHVQEFQENFARLIGVDHCIPCGNGTDAIYIALKNMGIGPGDEVITTAHSWIATSESISQTGATPVFVDTTKDTFTIDPREIESRINSKTRAIIPVHLYGQSADMDVILTLAEKYDLFVLEDCAQAHLAEYKGKKVGTMGDAATFSFYPGKNLGAMGDAGCIVTNNEELAEKCRRFANHGALRKHDHEMEGVNSRMDGIQAAVLNVKMKYIQSWTDRRIQIAEIYSDFLRHHPTIQIPKKEDWAKHVYHLYVIKTDRREDLIEALDSYGISTGIQYPICLPLLPVYRSENSEGRFPNASSNQDMILSLPMYPELQEEQISRVCQSIAKFLD